MDIFFFSGLLILSLALILTGYWYFRTESAEKSCSEEDPDFRNDRRSFLGLTAGGLFSALGTTLLAGFASGASSKENSASSSSTADARPDPDERTGYMQVQGTVDHEFNGFDPLELLVDWDYGKTHQNSDGQTVREYHWKALDKEIEIAPGYRFPAWTYEGRVPGPTIRCTEGDRIKIHFTNVGSHPHTIHFHGIHPFEMDGVPGAGPGEIEPGESFTYEFDAKPYGCHLYHCHSIPLKRHIHKGLYGAFIVDPKDGRPPARELMMLMNGFDTNFDGDNEIYAVNTVAHEYMNRPIPAKVGELIRIYLINVLEFDKLNSFHTHANFFDYYDHGTSLEPDRETVDTIMQTQAERGIVEVQYDTPGQFMFHAHQSEFAELGWMGKFNVVPSSEFRNALEDSDVDDSWNERATQGSTVQ